MSPRSVSLEVIYEGKDITEEITDYIESFVYVDAQDSSDSIALTLNNIDREWLNQWMPQLGDTINPVIHSVDGDGVTDSYDCGVFVVDALSYSGRPLVCTLSAVSSPVDEDFKATKKTRNWQGVSLSQIGMEIASAAKVSFTLDAPDIAIESLEQSRQTDAAFLKSLCDKYGYVLKTYSNRIIIIDPASYELRSPVAEFTEEDLSSWNYDAMIGGTYTGVRLIYTNTKGQTFSAELGDTSKRCLTLNETCDSDADAYNIAKGTVNKENESAYSFDCTLREAEYISSTSVITISDMDSISGNYYVKKVTHNISNGYTVSIETRRVVERIGDASGQAVAASGYPTIKYGSTDANSGGYVSQMQALLVAKGYHLPVFGVDGLFFSETRTAVKACQTDAGIAVDGICGPDTWGVLLGESKVAEEVVVLPPSERDVEDIKNENGDAFFFDLIDF